MTKVPKVKKSKTGSVAYAGSGHALGGSAFGTTCSLSPEDDPVGSFKIRLWREPKCLVQSARLNQQEHCVRYFYAIKTCLCEI